MDKKTKIIILIVCGVLVLLGIAFALSGGKPYTPSTAQSDSGSMVPADSGPKVPDNITQSAEGKTEMLDPKPTADGFRKEKGKIVMPTTLTYPASLETSAASKIMLGKKFNVTLTKNWLANIDGNTLSAVHTTGPSILITQTKLADKYFLDVVDTTLSDFLTASGCEKGYVGDIFYMDKVNGRRATSSILVGEETYVLDISIFLCDKELYQVVVIYPPETEETISALYNSIYYGEKNIKM